MSEETHSLRDLTRIEERFIRDVIKEVNHEVVMQGTPWCEQYLRRHTNHLSCPHFDICMIYWKCKWTIRCGETLMESDFRLKEQEDDSENYVD